MNIKKLVKPNVRALKAYHAEEVPCKVKLDANESPYGFRVLNNVKTNRYPDPEAKALRRLFAREMKVGLASVLHGNGSDELIYNLIAVFGGPVLYPVPTFSMYGIISQALNEKVIEIPLDDEFDIALDPFLKVIKYRRPGLIFLSTPNNPTGNCFTPEHIIKIIKQAKCPVIVDEAYQAFSGRNDFLPLLKKHKNLIIMRTLSKIGLAALRVGYMAAHTDIIEEVNKVRLPFNVNALSQSAAEEAVKDRIKLRSFIKKIVSERKRLSKELGRTAGIIPFRSDANFILFKADRSEKLFKDLLKKGVLIRNMNSVFRGCLRVTVGTPAENDAFLNALRTSVTTKH